MKFTVAIFAVFFMAARADDSNGLSGIPPSPYGATAFLVDYGISLENYRFILDSKTSNRTIRSYIKAFIAPLKDYQASYKNEDVTNDRRKSHIIGLSNFLSTDDSFNHTEITFDEWKEADMWNVVMNRNNLSKALKTRNDFFNSLSDPDSLAKVTKEYQDGIKNYTKILRSTKVGAYSELISDTIDWNLYESRYYELVMSIRTRNKQRTAEIRAYLASFLRDGDTNDSIYDLLVEEESVTTTKSNSSETKYRNVDRIFSVSSQTIKRTISTRTYASTIRYSATSTSKYATVPAKSNISGIFNCSCTQIPSGTVLKLTSDADTMTPNLIGLFIIACLNFVVL